MATDSLRNEERRVAKQGLAGGLKGLIGGRLAGKLAGSVIGAATGASVFGPMGAAAGLGGALLGDLAAKSPWWASYRAEKYAKAASLIKAKKIEEATRLFAEVEQDLARVQAGMRSSLEENK